MGTELIFDSIFYLLSLLFIWVEIFQIKNRFTMNNLGLQSLNPKLWIFFYFSKVIYFIWVILGLFTENYHLFSIFILLYLLRYFILMTKKNFYLNLFDLLSFVISVLILAGFTLLGAALLLL